MNDFTKEELKILEYVSEKVIEKHNTCLTDQFYNGYFCPVIICEDIENLAGTGGIGKI